MHFLNYFCDFIFFCKMKYVKESNWMNNNWACLQMGWPHHPDLGLGRGTCHIFLTLFSIFPFVSNMFTSSSQWVPIKFPICSLGSWNVFPITTCFNPICFPQNPLVFTYIGVLNGEAFHLSIESSILGGLHSLRWANQIGSLQKNKN